MTVKQLIARLKRLDQKAIVLLSSDSEGNEFSHVAVEFGRCDMGDLDGSPGTAMPVIVIYPEHRRIGS